MKDETALRSLIIPYGTFSHLLLMYCTRHNGARPMQVLGIVLLRHDLMNDLRASRMRDKKH